jgi:hypothetical protein
MASSASRITIRAPPIVSRREIICAVLEAGMRRWEHPPEEAYKQFDAKTEAERKRIYLRAQCAFHARSAE